MTFSTTGDEILDLLPPGYDLLLDPGAPHSVRVTLPGTSEEPDEVATRSEHQPVGRQRVREPKLIAVDHPDGESEAARLAMPVSEPERLTSRLDGLDPRARAALAASVADRLLPNYLRFHEHTGRGEPAVLQRALDDVWNRLHYGSPIDIVPVGLGCLEQTPLGQDDLADFSTVVTGNAVYAVWAVLGALHCAVHGRVLEVVHCLRYGRSSALAVAFARRDGAEPGRAEEQDSLVQREVRRQLRDLEALETAEPTAETLTWLRRSAIDP